MRWGCVLCCMLFYSLFIFHFHLLVSSTLRVLFIFCAHSLFTRCALCVLFPFASITSSFYPLCVILFACYVTHSLISFGCCSALCVKIHLLQHHSLRRYIYVCVCLLFTIDKNFSLRSRFVFLFFGVIFFCCPLLPTLYVYFSTASCTHTVCGRELHHARRPPLILYRIYI